MFKSTNSFALLPHFWDHIRLFGAMINTKRSAGIALKTWIWLVHCTQITVWDGMGSFLAEELKNRGISGPIKSAKYLPRFLK